MAMLSIWGITLVVMGHSGFTNDIIAANLSGLHAWIYSFHMPLFFFISGYLYSLTNKNFSIIDRPKFIRKKFDRLLIPYIALGCVVFVIKYAFSNLSSASRDFSLESFLYMFIAPQNANSTMGYLWYVITLFVIFIIAQFLSFIKINLKVHTTCVIVALVSWSASHLIPHTEILNLNGVLWYFPFFCMGILFQVSGVEKLIKYTKAKTLCISILTGGVFR